MEQITQAFYGVMHKYEKHFSAHGVAAVLKQWQKNKESLLMILRCHPDWDEDALGIVFQIVETRAIAQEVVHRHSNRLLQLARETGLTGERLQSFIDALAAASGDCSVSPSESNIQVLKEKGIRCAKGQKSSRIVGRVCQDFGVDTHRDYNKVFSQLSNALSPIETGKKAILSVHPCDYLEMSSKSSSWTSCHRLNGGNYQAGCLSYMLDSTSMVFYTVDSTVEADYHKAPRRTRQIFCYGGGVLLQSRLYPNNSCTDTRDLYRHLVQDAIATCLEIPNKWVIRKNQSELYSTARGSRHYTDYTSYGNVTTLKEVRSPQKLLIGSPSRCVCCGGDTVSSHSSLKCSCAALVVCADCGETTHAENARYHNNKWVCKSCLRICAYCGHVVSGGLVVAFDGRGGIERVCHTCASVLTAPCAQCSVRSICAGVTGNRFCPRTAVRVAA